MLADISFLIRGLARVADSAGEKGHVALSQPNLRQESLTVRRLKPAAHQSAMIETRNGPPSL
jgi:ferritin-like metal-binding protein YciE